MVQTNEVGGHGSLGLLMMAVLVSFACKLSTGSSSDSSSTGGKSFGSSVNVSSGSAQKGNWGTMLGLTWNWATGTGPEHATFTDDSVALALADSNVVNQARNWWYGEVKAGNKAVTDGFTNFRGKKVLTGGNFGISGLFKAGLDPVEQFIGSFSVAASSNGERLTYSIQNNSSMKSVLYGLGPAYDRSTFSYGGNMTQTYTFSESIDHGRLQ